MDSSKINLLEKLITAEVTCMFTNIPTEAEIESIANKYKLTIGGTDEECKQAIKNIHSKMSITLDEGILIKGDTEFVQWYDSRRAELEFKFWNRYKDYLLLKKDWSENVVNTIDKVSNDIVSLLGNPMEKGPWKRRGLVIGDVQSGKTANFTAICNKAVDVGYDVIIVLTGTLESLRRQTQERQDSDLVGLDSFKLLNNNGKENRLVGVGEIDKSIRLMTFTSTRSDFRTNIVDNIGLSLESCKDTALFVVKKNKKVLENLENWLKYHNANENGQINSSVLIIDDESDNASVNTSEEENPTAINRCIRNLLNCFTKESYVAVTATPYANIFINDETASGAEEMYGQDLFPKDFIYCLAAPSNYIGAKDIFLRDGKYYNSLEVIDDAGEYLQLKHKSTDLIEDVPDSLRDAVYHFILVNAIRDYRGEENTHRSMLVNVSRFTNIQNQFAQYLEEWIEELKRNINNFANLTDEESLKNKYIKDLKNIWNKFNFISTSGCTWETIRKKYLAKAIFTIKVQAVNQSSSSKNLDYNLYKSNGYRVIAVGGNSLSRGITLEGLCTTYFYRNSQTYDTLMQMGRWFGYRSGYEDLFKIWMTIDAIDWYGTICEATEELKNEIQKMNNKNFTPKEFGLRVKEDPASLIVTAKNKMKNTQVLERDIDVSGRVLETVSIDCKNMVIKGNFNLILSELKAIKDVNVEKFGKSTVVRNLSKEQILNIVNNFNIPLVNISFNQEAIVDYIIKSEHLENWDLIIPGGSTKKVIDINLGGTDIKIEKEQRKLKYENKFINVYKTNGRIITGESLKIGLTQERIDKVKERVRRIDPKGKVMNSDYLYEGRNPLIFIHFIEATEVEKVPENIKFPEDTFVALSLGFPMTSNYDKKKAKARYRINMVAVKQLFDFDEDDDI